MRSSVNLYELGGPTPVTEQPSILSDDDASAHAIGWTALGSLTGDPANASTLYAASDSVLAEGRVYTIDASATPARIVRARSVTEEGTAASGLDIEGLDARAGGGGFWLASEGATDAGNEIIRTDSRLAIQERVSLPAEVTDHVGKWGLEGIDSAVNAKGEEVVYVALQRPLWVDPSAKPLEALEGATTNRIGRYNTVTGE